MKQIKENIDRKFDFEGDEIPGNPYVEIKVDDIMKERVEMKRVEIRQEEE